MEKIGASKIRFDKQILKIYKKNNNKNYSPKKLEDLKYNPCMINNSYHQINKNNMTWKSMIKVLNNSDNKIRNNYKLNKYVEQDKGLIKMNQHKIHYPKTLGLQIINKIAENNYSKIIGLEGFSWGHYCILAKYNKNVYIIDPNGGHIFKNSKIQHYLDDPHVYTIIDYKGGIYYNNKTNNKKSSMISKMISKLQKK